MTLTYRVIPRVSLGLELNPLNDYEVNPLLNAVALTETKTRPAWMFGTSSDRIGTPDGQAYYSTFSKNLQTVTGGKVPIAPYAGASYGTFDYKLRAIGGFWAGFGKGFSTTFIWDGVDLHPTIDYRYKRHVFTALWVRLEELGVAYSIVF